MERMSIIRFSTAVLAATAFLVPRVASAQPPANDRLADAMVAEPLPFAHLADYSEATSSDDEPLPCWDPLSKQPVRPQGLNETQTLWYRYDARERMGLVAYGYRVVNENGFLDLGIYRATEDRLENVGCVSSSPSSNWTDPFMIRAQPGETYFFMMSMNTYPDDTAAWFHLRSTEPADLSVRSLSVTSVHHETDIGVIHGGQEFDLSFQIANAIPGTYVTGMWTLDVCTRPAVSGTARCQTWNGTVYSVSDREVQVTHRATGLGLGEFEATVRVIPAWAIDQNPADDTRSTGFNVVAEGLGFGV